MLVLETSEGECDAGTRISIQQRVVSYIHSISSSLCASDMPAPKAVGSNTT